MRRFVLVLACLLTARAGSAQLVQGRVVTTAGAMVSGAVVSGLDTMGTPVVVALADDSGRFSLSFPSPRAARLRIERVGFAPTETPSFSVVSDSGVERTVVVAATALALPAERRDASACITADADPAARAVWEQARIALLATRLTRLTRGYTMDVDVMVRHEPADRRQQTTNDRKLIVGTPLRALTSVSPELLADSGYVAHDATGDHFQAPHEDVLLSASFGAAHCLRLLPWDAGAATVRIGFEPDASRRLPDVRGTLTLDRATLALRRVDFTYTGIGQPNRAGDVSGYITYRQLAEGAWITGSWQLAETVIQQFTPQRPLVAGRFGAPPAPRTEIISGTSRFVSGGTVVRVRSRDAVIPMGDDTP